MGGIGSGRHWHFSAKNTTNGFRSVDVRRWAREGYLRPGTRFGWQWTMDGEEVASIRVATETGNVRLIYRTRSHGDDWRDMNYPVGLDRTACHLGGERTWFRCPARGCGRRVAILYGGEVFACRHCYQLAYPSQRENPMSRSMRRVEKLRDRLDCDDEGYLVRPKGMHHKTFDRLLTEIEAADNAASLHWLTRFRGYADFAEALADLD